MLFLPKSAGIAMIRANTATAITPLNGTRSRFTLRKIAQPGIARSRAKAYQVREALVRHAVPQKSWPMVAIRMISFAAHESMELVKDGATKPAPALTAPKSVAGNREAMSR